MKTFKSKYDSWMLVSLALVGIALIGAVAVKPTAGIVVTVLLTVAFVVYVFRSIEYIVDGEILTVCMPFLKNSIPVSQITKVERVTSFLSAPACSIRRLRIHYGSSYETIDISPKDETAFLDAIGKSVE